MKPKYLVEYRVRGARTFPDDMLRYDASKPRSEEDKISIERFTHANLENDTITYQDYCQTREVELIAYRDTKHATNFVPCVDRWSSFGWRVLNKRVSKL